MKNFILIITLLCCFTACNKVNVKEQLKNMLGKQIYIPELKNVIVNGRDTIIPLEISENLKIVIFHDENECTSCNATQLYDWNNIIDSLQSINNFITPIFIFTPSQQQPNNLKITLKSLRLSYSAYIDSDYEFMENNPFIPKDKRFHVFLIDKNNNILLVGNPLNNHKILDLYKNTLSEFIKD